MTVFHVCIYIHSLGYNNITDSGLLPLSAVVEKLVNLQELSYVGLATTVEEAGHG